MVSVDQVEARSLASLNFLAANPPQYPVNPTEALQEPLTLYISRVPGTRDIILSTFKPQLKSVTAEDVANSLYYVHLELPFEGLSPPGPVTSGDSPRSSQESSRSTPNQIRRKPLPNRPNGSLGVESQAVRADAATTTATATATASVPQTSPVDKPRLDWGSSNAQLEGGIPHMLETAPALPPRPTAPTPIPRRPLGPRPMTPTRHDGTSPDHDNRNAGQPQQPSLAPRPAPASLASPQYMPGRSPSPTKRAQMAGMVPFSLCLIRRDPSSGHQWNIGRVSSYQLDPAGDGTGADQSYFSPDRPSSLPVSEHPINITLETSGYAKFRGFSSTRGGGASLSDSAASLPRPSTGHGNSQHNEARSPQELQGTFQRQVVMTYRQSWTSNIKDKLRRSENSQSPPPAPAPQPATMMTTRHVRQSSSLSAVSIDSAGSASDVPAAAILTQPGHGLKPQGYMFVSPWDGRCEFTTGSAGRSVRCRHVLEKSSGVVNPLVPSSHGRHGSLLTGAAPVSELRFNLPTADLFKSKDAAQQLHGHFSKLLRMDHHGTESDEEEEEEAPPSPFDLHLGKEKAGGGNRGKRAKLGKLIVQHDGLKMLDLVVAANMGLWWRAWEKSF